jgi:paraquat-inducible protein B
MSESGSKPDEPDKSIVSDEIPTAIIRRRRFSFAWVVPIIALAIVGYMIYTQVAHEKGTMITIRFDDASGLEPGSEIRHRGVTVGIVRAVALDDDLAGVEVRAELVPGASRLAVAGTRFWVVHPTVSLKGIAGLDTLLGPKYIALQPGDPGGAIEHAFVALDEPPAAEPMRDGSLRLVLRADRLGTLSPGNPVLYREIRVGSVRDARLTNDGTAVLINIDIEPRYAPLVHDKTRFWRSGGMGVDFGIFSGLSVQADSLEAVLSSAISLATPTKKPGERAKPGDEFELADEVDGDWLKWSPRIELGG